MNNLNDRINQAFALFDAGDLRKAEFLYLACLEQLEERRGSAYKSILHGLGYVRSGLEQYDLARLAYEELACLARSEDDLLAESIALHQLGMVERLAGCYEAALDRFDSGLALLNVWQAAIPESLSGREEAVENMHLSANAYEQGYVRLKLGRISDAENRMKDALDKARLANDFVCQGCAYRGLGEIYRSAGSESLAVSNFKAAAEAFRRSGDEKSALHAEASMRRS